MRRFRFILSSLLCFYNPSLSRSEIRITNVFLLNWILLFYFYYRSLNNLRELLDWFWFCLLYFLLFNLCFRLFFMFNLYLFGLNLRLDFRLNFSLRLLFFGLFYFSLLSFCTLLLLFSLLLLFFLNFILCLFLL